MENRVVVHRFEIIDVEKKNPTKLQGGRNVKEVFLILRSYVLM